MVLSRQLHELSKLQSFDNRMDSMYKDGLPDDGSERRVGPKQMEFIQQRQSMVRELDGSLVRQYERMRRSRIKANAVVPVAKGVCQGCFMVITKSLLAELVNGDSLVTCEHCGRILYLE
jgi:predicted  nucleic acid-binding Zn-ribbon protein